MARKSPALKKQNNQQHVELRGEVRAADLDGRQFSLRLDNGTRIIAEFTSAQERTITEALREHASRRVLLKGNAEVAHNGRIKRVASVESLTVEPAEPGPSSKPIWEVALEIGASVREKEWAKAPSDLAQNLHHYLHGAPKESDR
jgi:hypothetical protein